MSPMVLFDPEIARPLLAGWIMGAVVGLADTALLVIAIARSRRWPQQLSGLHVSLPIFAIAAANGMMICWTLIGLVLGALWIVVPMPKFAIGVGGAILGILGVYAYIRGLGHRGEAQVVVGSGALAAVAFGGVLPLLASMR